MSNLRFPWKQSCPGIFHCIEYTFYIQNFLATCACPGKQRVHWIYCTECIFFIIQDFWATCACPENRVCPELFQARGGRPQPEPPPCTPMASGVRIFNRNIRYAKLLHSTVHGKSHAGIESEAMVFWKSYPATVWWSWTRLQIPALCFSHKHSSDRSGQSITPSQTFFRGISIPPSKHLAQFSLLNVEFISMLRFLENNVIVSVKRHSVAALLFASDNSAAYFSKIFSNQTMELSMNKSCG